ncbi:DUF4031 domain-containing protein [Serinibacter salmoneus]|uniref:Putative metal-dependent HD superfamily phosphohydrolase n=1 Tax=Serinibacter salmoneus TaxID=556530 RepID=A0A2A9D1D3_9MICO|nr:DUF4031 domain-containing protein [Serinibacter salmoneus]PFG20518.1 putative metal-dependent HD superfamily phosphohydrolase [Serinibacter salmoneus]
MILIDPPVWPAHGTVFSHLVSDASLGELHTFAVAAGIPARAFDGDHYDVAARWHEVLIARGAAPVSGGDLVRRLRASGLRRTAHARRAERDDLRRRWAGLSDGSTPGAAWGGIGEDLLARWSQRGRLHHGLTHLREVLDAVDLLTARGQAPNQVRRRALLGAWFHDAVHRSGRAFEHQGGRAVVPGQDERDSAALARAALAGTRPAREGEAVAALVTMTADHRPSPGDQAAAILSDADLSVLGSSPTRYADYAAAIRGEYADVPEADFRAGRAAILRDLLAGDLFHTPAGRARWEDAARRNIADEITRLTSD